MPVFEYECPKCGTIMEEFFYIDSYPRFVRCIKCHTKAPKIISAPHIGGSHTNKMTESVPGENLSMTVDGFKMVKTPDNIRKKIRKGARRLKKKREPKRLKTVREF